MSQETRQRILQAGARLIHGQGFNNTGIQEILRESGVPKGSFYFYFKSKEAFGLQVVKQFNEHWATRAREILGDPAQPALQRLRNFFGVAHEVFCAKGYVGGCLVGNLAQEMADVSPVMAQSLAEALDAMAGRFAQVLEEARQAGQIAPDSDCRALGYFILAAWQGALIRMKACKNSDPLDIFMDTVFGRLLAV